MQLSSLLDIRLRYKKYIKMGLILSCNDCCKNGLFLFNDCIVNMGESFQDFEADFQ